MAFAILRTEKLKTLGNIGGSLSHNYRDRETLNADPGRTPDNEHSLVSAEAVKTAISERLPEKIRSNAVLCIEHLITASPEWDGWGTDKEVTFFERSKQWLNEKYGSQNVISVSIHRDETTPHLVAYVVPLDPDTGHLNARKWLGGKAKLSMMQTDFAKTVNNLGLERGIEGSKAKHTAVRDYYNDVNNYEPQPSIELEAPEPSGIFESKAEYAERIIESVLEQINPKLKELSLLANQTKTAKKDAANALRTASEARKALSELQDKVKPYLDAQNGLDESWKRYFDETLETARKKILDQQKKWHDERQKQLEQEQSQQRKKQFDHDWNNTYRSLSSEQIESYNFLRDHIVKFEKDQFYRDLKIESLKRNMINDHSYALTDYSWRYREKEQPKRQQEHDQEQKNDKGQDFDFF